MKMASKEFAAWCFDREIRIASIIWLAAVGDSESPTEAMREFLDDQTDKALSEIFGSNIEEPLDEDGEEGSSGERRDYLLGLITERHGFGFLVNAETPVRTYAPDHKSSRYSWGHYSSKWFYVEALDETLLGAMEKWVVDRKRDDIKYSDEIRSTKKKVATA